MNRRRASAGIVIALALVLGCRRAPTTGESPAPAPSSRSWPEADALFHADPRWLGADAAYSIDLGDDRTLWLFGDTFVATSPKNVRRESVMVRNSVGVQKGRDPTRGAIAFSWAKDDKGAPTSFFADQGETWHWPGHGVRLGPKGPLVVFLSIVRATPGAGLGFAIAGWRVARIDGADAEPATWKIAMLDPPKPPFDAIVGCAAIAEGDHVVAVAPRDAGTHVGYLARFRKDDLAAGRATPEWWAGARGWVAQAALGGAPEVVIDDAGSECSVHFDPKTARFVHVASRGFGATTVAVRTAPALTGPWSAPVDVFTPPESKGTRPFVYAAKAHPELVADDARELVVTYATNAFDPETLLRPEGQALYWPRFVRARLPVTP